MSIKQAIAALFIAIGVTGCKDGLKNVIPPNPTTTTSVMGDETDLLKKQPSDHEVLQYYGLSNDDNIYNGYVFRFKDVQDVSMTDIKTYEVQPEYSLLANRNSRIAALKNFRARVQETLKDANTNNHTTKKQSRVYQAVANECNYLSKCGSTNRNLILYTDLLDHSSDLDLYNPLVMEMVKSHPDQVLESLEKIIKIQPLNGVHVYIVYQSQNPDDENRFMVASNFYRYVLTQKGATVEVTPSLTIN
jgi:hypothetical protein